MELEIKKKIEDFEKKTKMLVKDCDIRRFNVECLDEKPSTIITGVYLEVGFH